MAKILSAVSKLRGCVNQIENKNPSGASDQDILNQAKMLLRQDVKYKTGFKFDHVWPILKGIEKFASNHTSRTTAFQEERRNVMSSQSFQDESSPSHGMSSFDLNMSSEETTFNSSQRPIGVKKAKKQQQSSDQFKQMMEQSDKLIKAISKGCRAYIENEREKILKRRAPTDQYEEHGEGSHSQYRASQNQGDQTQGNQFQGNHVEGGDERAPNDPQDFTQYYRYLGGDGNYFPGN
ncbi:unnamed protein product [Microthlaspi erraticum]|uniref:No apical meristem-associated C-terminal domain-containing protein n=1 Tax=Microthlaspi erraticum TaxID=1685480 RepID=A0A6D2IWD4_9BRAS|nr:unnamed protein product [Microthlaspi erraticum]CAA7031949.1 unnamed protein product [Microthlaspi erraticum]CAA7031951.1 unnamed protein product [Microthlaspi erraticum]CAA7038448.1 unnamed protein product [Microthlaspi erraticum]CAA7040340.1 unnamed protein product [Microthlaspi erraticum]